LNRGFVESFDLSEATLGVRPKDDQPLILLTQQDVLRELCKIKEQLDTLEREEADWAQARLLQYRERLVPTFNGGAPVDKITVPSIQHSEICTLIRH